MTKTMTHELAGPSNLSMSRPGRRRNFRWHLALALVAAASVTACASRSATIAAPIDSDLSRYTTVAVSVQSTVADDRAWTEGANQEMVSLRARIVEKIVETGRFKVVREAAAVEAAPDTLVLTTTITEIRRVSGTQRFVGGAFAGRAGITLETVLTAVEAVTSSGSPPFGGSRAAPVSLAGPARPSARWRKRSPSGCRGGGDEWNLS